MLPIHENYDFVRLLWAGLKPSSRRSYNSAVRSYEAFCDHYKVRAWPATVKTLSKWVFGRVFGDSSVVQMGQIKHTTISGYLSSLRSVHVDMNYDVAPFANPLLRRLIDGAANLFPAGEQSRKTPFDHPTVEALFTPRATADEHPLDTINLNACIATAYSGMCRLSEVTTEISDAPDDRTRIETQLTGRCLTTSPLGDHMLLLLPRSKTDKHNRGVEIMLTPSGDSTCALAHLALLMGTGVGPRDPLFRFHDGRPWNKSNFKWALFARLRRLGLSGHSFTGHSFRAGGAQRAADNGVPRDKIMQLGRWTSDAVDRYFKQSRAQRYAVHQQFVTGRATPIVEAHVCQPSRPLRTQQLHDPRSASYP